MTRTVHRLYLSGPMTGRPELNVPAFNRAARALRREGFEVVNPAEINCDPEMEWHQAMRADIKALCDCDVVVLLPDWESSKGAHLELHVAHRLGLSVTTLQKLLGAA